MEAIITIFLFLIKWAFILGFFIQGLGGIPYAIFVEHNLHEILNDGTITIFIIMIIIMVVVSFLYSKFSIDTFSSSFIKLSILSIIFSYVLMLIVYKNTSIDLYNTITFKINDFSESFFRVYVYCATTSVIPVIISEIIYRILVSKEEKKQFEKEQARQLEEQKRKQEIEDTNKEIEYLKKLNDLEKLLKEETINQERFNYLKSKLDKQYNKL